LADGGPVAIPPVAGLYCFDAGDLGVNASGDECTRPYLQVHLQRRQVGHQPADEGLDVSQAKECPTIKASIQDANTHLPSSASATALHLRPARASTLVMEPPLASSQ